MISETGAVEPRTVKYDLSQMNGYYHFKMANQ